MNKIILVEDDEKLSSLIKQYLQQQGFEVKIISNGNLAIEAIISLKPDIVILDLMLPGKDGLSICREVRPQYKGIILFLTASDDDMDHVIGIEIGADDFITKPIQPRVLLARIRMLLRRAKPLQSNEITQSDTSSSLLAKKVLSFGKLHIYHSKRLVLLADEIVPLTTGEFDLLLLFARHPERILSRDFIFKTLRGIEYDGMDRAIDTKVANLRKKLGDNASLSKRIITVRGQGYLFVPDSWN